MLGKSTHRKSVTCVTIPADTYGSSARTVCAKSASLHVLSTSTNIVTPISRWYSIQRCWSAGSVERNTFTATICVSERLGRGPQCAAQPPGSATSLAGHCSNCSRDADTKWRKLPSAIVAKQHTTFMAQTGYDISVEDGKTCRTPKFVRRVRACDEMSPTAALAMLMQCS
eukprot:2064686-Pleurochrysis_carterae.AAC.2